MDILRCSADINTKEFLQHSALGYFSLGIYPQLKILSLIKEEKTVE
jgi:hypothetical protein